MNTPTTTAQPQQPAPKPAASSAPSSQPAQPKEQPVASPSQPAQPQQPPATPPAKHAQLCGTLDQSIEDAYILLNFACRQRRTLDDGAAQVIIASHIKKSTGTPLGPAEESAFWDAFSKVIALVEPVTVESIIYTTVKTESRFAWLLGRLSRGELALRRHLYLAIITLLALLFLQVQWAMGTSIYNDAFKVHQKYLAATNAHTDAQRLAQSVADTNAAPEATAALDKAKEALQMDQSWSNVSYLQLHHWNRQILSWMPLVEFQVAHDETGSVSLSVEGLKRAEFNHAELILKIISNYFLVFLFALLGAVTQSLRAMSQEIADVSLTANTVFRGLTRIILGVISGVCVAWLYLIGTENNTATGHTSAPLDIISFLGAFTPWALAFVSGYSVEIFFTALERFIVLVTDKIKSAIPLPGEQASKTTPATQQPKPTPQPKPTSQPSQAPFSSPS